MAVIRSIDQMLKEGFVAAAAAERLTAVKEQFDFLIPEAMTELIAQGHTEVAKQFVPSTEELIISRQELVDPIGDEAFSPVEGITHRYPDRVLLKLTHACGVYCRFCFRRYKVSKDKRPLDSHKIDRAIDYIGGNENIWEVILTGGDPLILSDHVLKSVLQKLKQISHVKIVRFHTRIPVVQPARITPQLIEILKISGKQVWFGIHVNTAAELTPSARDAVAQLTNAGVSFVSQTVLLRDINDNVQSLKSLFRLLVEVGIKPYYLHYPDLAQGTNHFRIPLERAVELIGTLRGEISGLCLPELIVDIPGGHGKINLGKTRFRQIDGEAWEFESPTTGQWIQIRYPKCDTQTS